MRNKILELLPTLIDASMYINKSKMENSLNVINDMQFAIESIISTLSESFTSSTFNKYKKITDDIEQKLLEIKTKKQDGKEVANEIKLVISCINKLTNNLKSESEVKLEILFIPYKYSMWDSLESIWIAADNDPRCNARVMPIPYYERDENGLLADFKYEIDSFIKNGIPAIPYKDYDYTVVRPDIIYFHNPYDGNNLVTSVSPEYYTEQLKNYTDMLVYVPYFIAGYYTNKDNARPFCMSPGILNATKFITQSEQTKNLYTELGADPKKIEALGSPKLDAIKNIKSKINIPKKWQKLNNKKVILLNSSITNFLNDDNYLDNIKEVISAILEKDDVGLIWRPHPLFESTIKSMKIERVNEFNEIKKIISNNNNAFIDNSEDAYNAIYYSDAMISDHSSLIQLYIMTEKPIYLLYGSKELKNEVFVAGDYFSSYFSTDLELEEFLIMIKGNSDPQKHQRISDFKKSVLNVDGTSGEKIHKYIINEFK